jgi:AcrR family transcriptional regulator
MARMSSEDRRVELMRAALRVIAERGVGGATTRAIVSEAGMSLASFHYAFSSRDEMLHALIAHVVETQTVAAFSMIPVGGDIRTTVRAGLQAFFETVVADPGHEQVMFELMHVALRTPGLEDLPRRQNERYREAATELLRAAAVNCDIRWSLPVGQIAHLVVTITDGLTVAWLANRDLAAAALVMDFAAGSLAALATPAGRVGRQSFELQPSHTKERTT